MKIEENNNEILIKISMNIFKWIEISNRITTFKRIKLFKSIKIKINHTVFKQTTFHAINM